MLQKRKREKGEAGRRWKHKKKKKTKEAKRKIILDTDDGANVEPESKVVKAAAKRQKGLNLVQMLPFKMQTKLLLRFHLVPISPLSPNLPRYDCI